MREPVPHWGGDGPGEGRGREQEVAGFGHAWGQPGGHPGCGNRKDASWAQETGRSGRSSLRSRLGAGDGRNTRRRTRRAATRPRLGPDDQGSGGLGRGGHTKETGSQCPRAEGNPDHTFEWLDASHRPLATHCPLLSTRSVPQEDPVPMGPCPTQPGLAHRQHGGGQHGREAWGVDSAGSLSGSPWTPR